MSLTKRQANAAMLLFVNSFVKCNSAIERKKIFLDFEDSFGTGIRDWQVICKEKLEQLTSSKEIIEHFIALINRESQNKTNECLIRKLVKSDLTVVCELLNYSFNMHLTSYDDNKFDKFIESGYSFVAYCNDEVIGVLLGYLIPDLSMDAVYIDAVAVSENMRGCGIGKKLISEVSKSALSNGVHLLKLHTDRTIEAYQIYKHLKFEESKFALMKKYIL